MKKIYSTLIVLCVCMCCILHVSTIGAQGASKSIYRYPSHAAIAIDDSVKVGHLANGLTYYIRANHKPENRVQFRLVVNAGSVLEDDSQRGLAHFCEHMAFNGTKYYKGNSMIGLLQQQGVAFGEDVNAYTSFDETVYYVNLPSNKPDALDMGFKILSGWASGLLLSKNEINKERGVILEEWRSDLGATDRMEKQTWPRMLYGSQYACRLPIGSDTIIRTFKPAALQQYYHDWYRPDLQAIVIVGDIQPAEMEKQILAYFDTCTAPVAPRERPIYDIPSNIQPIITIASDPEATDIDVDMYWKHPHKPILTLTDYKDYLVGELVTGMIQDRLNEISNSVASPYVHALCCHDSYYGRTTDALELYAQVKEPFISETVIELLRQAYMAVQYGFLASELERQKAEIYSQYVNNAREYANITNGEWAEACTMHYLLQQPMAGAIREYEYVQQLLPNISIADVNDKLKAWITDSNFVMCVTAPEVLKSMLDTNDFKNLYNEIKSVEHAPYNDNYSDRPLMPAVPADTKPLSAYIKGYNRDMGCVEMRLDNGVKVLIQPTRYKNDEIIMQAFHYGGSSLCSNEDAFVAEHVAGIISESGLGDFTATDMQKYLKGKQVWIGPYIEECSSGFNGSCTANDITTMLQMLTLYFTSPRYDQESMDKYVMGLRTQYEHANEWPQLVFMDQFRKTCYPYDRRTVTIPTEEQWQRFNLEKIASIYSQQFAYADSFTFIFTGNIDSNIIHQIADYVGQLPVKGVVPVYVNRSTSFAEGKVVNTLYKGKESQAMVVMAGVNTRFQWNPQQQLLARMLGAALDITLIEEVREKAGVTYSPGVSVYTKVLPQHALAWQMMVECSPKSVAKVESMLLKIWQRYMQNGPDELTLNKVKEQLINEREIELKTNEFWSDELKKVCLYKIDSENYNNYRNKVMAVTTADLQAFAAKYIDLGNFVTLELMPEAKAKKK